MGIPSPFFPFYLECDMVCALFQLNLAWKTWTLTCFVLFECVRWLMLFSMLTPQQNPQQGDRPVPKLYMRNESNYLKPTAPKIVFYEIFPEFNNLFRTVWKYKKWVIAMSCGVTWHMAGQLDKMSCNVMERRSWKVAWSGGASAVSVFENSMGN